jgi:hypothetical protein
MSTTAQTGQRMGLATAIRTSLRAFVFGMFGFIPIIGLVPGLYVLACWRRVHTEFGDDWNPAAPYLVAGIVLSVLGLIGSVCLVFGIIASITLS